MNFSHRSLTVSALRAAATAYLRQPFLGKRAGLLDGQLPEQASAGLRRSPAFVRYWSMKTCSLLA